MSEAVGATSDQLRQLLERIERLERLELGNARLVAELKAPGSRPPSGEHPSPEEPAGAKAGRSEPEGSAVTRRGLLKAGAAAGAGLALGASAAGAAPAAAAPPASPPPPGGRSEARESGDLVRCSFCGKSQKQVDKLIAGPGVYICNECIDLCNEIIEEERAEGPR